MRGWVLPGSAALASLLFVVVLHVSTVSGVDVTVLSDGVQLLAAMCASAGCAVGARRSRGAGRRAWGWLSAGTGCWAAGQAVWSWYEVVLGREVPFPSLADVGFLAFPLVAGVGLVLWPGPDDHHLMTRGRDVMDGAIIAVSFVVLSWVTVMGPLVVGSEGSGFSLALSLAYPVGDVVLATLVLFLLSRSESERTLFMLLALGLGGFALADSLFSYLTSAGTYSSANLVSSGGWVAGFLFVGAAGVTGSRARSAEVVTRPTRRRTSSVWVALPYVPLVGAGVALFVDLLVRESSELADLLLGMSLVAMVLVRQFLVVVDNQRLMRALGDAGAKLEHLATHDALTGLPNRMLFDERLRAALASPASSATVLFCDLDDFKPVNDELGHAGGDRLLRIVADRLLCCVRESDTVARLGGDEFAVVLVDCPDPRVVADRVVACIAEEALVLGRTVHPTISVGLAEHPGSAQLTTTSSHRGEDGRTGDRAAAAGRLLHLADAAMYRAKSSGKGRVAVHERDGAMPDGDVSGDHGLVRLGA